MFRRLSAVLRPADPADRTAGLSLVEVIVAMMVFAVVAVGVAYSITNSLVLTRESRARAIATNLAAQDIDLLRSVEDVFAVTGKTWTTQVSGFDFTVRRTAAWAPEASDATACGVGTGSLQYKTVTVSITYEGMRPGIAPITSSTVLAPNDRINDPTKGTIVVQVTGASGAGAPGVGVAISAASPAAGAVAPASPPVTNADGCTYALKVAPGNYTVSISKAGSVTPKQEATASKTPVTVTKGATASAQFTYDAATSIQVQPGQGLTPTPLRPTNLDVTFRNSTFGNTVLPASSASPARLFPFTGGYQVMAGRHVDPTTETDSVTRSCLSPDPLAWVTPAPDGAIGRELVPVGSGTVEAPMGMMRFGDLSGGNTALAAVQQNSTANGDPGCSDGSTYYFPAVTSGQTFALPFGTWKFYRYTTAKNGTRTLGAQVVPPADALLTRGVVDRAQGTVLVDPRSVAP